MNYARKSIAIAVPTTLLSAPVYAHGGGLFLVFVGFPLLAGLFLFYVIGALISAPKGKRFSAFIRSLFIGALWVAIFIGPWFQHNIENFLSDHEVAWAIAIPSLLFIGSWFLHQYFKPAKNYIVCKYTA